MTKVAWPKRLLLLSMIALLPVVAFAQSSGGTLHGIVTDETGAALPGVSLTATNTATGFNRTAVTSGDGTYRFANLPVGTYSVVAELSGFASVTTQNVTINVAREREVNVSLRQAAVREAITVTAEAPLIATTPAIGTTVSQSELENLPLNGRQFANLATLAPGTSLGVNPDPTKGGQLVVAMNGGIGRNVNYTVDGGDNTDDTIGGALQNFNLDAVQEFNIQTMQYKAEYGRSTGGVLSVVTKSGTNDLSGNAFGFFRTDTWNTETEAESRAGLGKSPYDRKQYGLSLGGPIIRDRAHFFLTYEKTDRESAYVFDSRGAFPDLDKRFFPAPFEDELLTAKATYDLNARHLFRVRYGAQENTDTFGASRVIPLESTGINTNENSSLLLGHTWQIGGDKLNEFLYQWSRFDNSILPRSNEPTVFLASGVLRGQHFNTPQSTSQEKSQFKDDFSWSSNAFGKRHDLKAGVNYVHEPVLTGTFTAGTTGQYVLSGNSFDSPVTQITVFCCLFVHNTPVDQYSAYMQDDLQVSNRLTVNVGLRYDYFTGFDIDQRTNPIWQALSTQTRFNDDYLRDFQGGKGGVLKNDDDNWGPRLGFSYDVRGDGRHMLRGGWGIYHDFPYTNATILFPAAVVQADYGVTYFLSNPGGIRNADGSLYRVGQPLPAGGARTVVPNEVGNPTLATPKSQQTSIGYSWQAANWLGLTFEAVTIDYSDLPFRFRANPGIDADGNGVFEPAKGEVRRFPQFGSFRMWYGKGEASYDGFNTGVRARVSEQLELQGFYTLSRAEGNILAGADEFRLTATTHQPELGAVGDQSVNPLDPLCDACFGPLNTDARHRLTLGLVYRAPFAINVSGFYRYRSAYPYTEWAGRDLNGDSYAMDLPAGVDHVNNLRGESFSQLDVRLAKDFRFGGNLGIELIGEVFNLFNASNPALFVGNRLASTFGQPQAFAGDPLQGEQRLIQLGARVRF